MNNTNTINAAQMKELLKRFNHGVKNVAIEFGIVCVYVSTPKAAKGVTMDLLLSRGFRSVKATANMVDGGYIVHAMP